MTPTLYLATLGPISEVFGLLAVMPRAIPKVARTRVEFTMGRAAPMAAQGVPKGLVAEAAVTVERIAAVKTSPMPPTPPTSRRATR